MRIALAILSRSIPNRSPNSSTVDETSLGLAGLRPTLVNGPSVSVRIRSSGSAARRARLEGFTTICWFTEKITAEVCCAARLFDAFR